ncbi:2-oxoacid:acceptor oxidoreductase family protein [Moorella sulfitireducens]|uniref:2-oxoacid:acceptor oxidoreductase family protein n=1 Tax=Neomoorella sulfitireducens TaxID=2972948 RepID=UPI0021ACB5BE|nr:2-oxoacid:acceptor oxidoreductase family protein [Moorella sulfitireducens]
MIEIRFHGRYGQPVTALAGKVAQAALAAGKYAQVFENFGAYRPGAAMQAVVRIDDDFIRERSANATRPDVVVVLDNSLLAIMDVTRGLKTGGQVIAINADPEVKKSNQSVNWQLISLDSGAGVNKEEVILAALSKLGVFTPHN